MKPYKFVPLNREVQRAGIRNRDRLDRHLYNGKIVVRAEVKRPLVIGSGRLTLHDNKMVLGMVLLRGKPVIPGSTLKGAVRSIFESVTYSCVQAPSIKDFRDTRDHLPRGNQVPCKEQVCPACQVFGFVNGSQKGSSLIQFADMMLEGNKDDWIEVRNIPVLFTPLRNTKAIGKYLDNDELFQRKFFSHGQEQDHKGNPFTVVKEGAVFRGEIHFQNLTREEIGAVIFSLGIGLDRPYTLKMGYAKPAYYGSLKLSLEAVEPYQSFIFSGKEFSREELIHAANEYGENDGFIREQKGRVQEVLNFEENQENTWATDEYGNMGY